MKKALMLFITFIMLFTCIGCGGEAVPPADDTPAAVADENNAEPEQDEDIRFVENTDGVTRFAIFSDAHVGRSSLANNRLKRSVIWANKTSDLDFILFLGDNVEDGYFNSSASAEQVKLLNDIMADSTVPYYYLKGNHDANTPDFEDNFIIECGDVAVVGFFASYYCPDPDDIYLNYGKVSAETQLWLEQAFKKCAGKRIILACHFSIVTDDPENFTSPIAEAQGVKRSGGELVDFGREKILSLAEQYNVELYFNGHEHREGFVYGKAGTLTDYNCPGLGISGFFADVTVDSEKAVIRWRDNKKADEVVTTQEYVFTRTIK